MNQLLRRATVLSLFFSISPPTLATILFDSSLDLGLSAQSVEDCEIIDQNNRLKYMEMAQLHSQCIKAHRGQPGQHCMSVHCDEIHIAEFTVAAQRRAAKSGCLARVRAIEKLTTIAEDEMLPDSAQKALKLEQMWSSANTLKSSCAAFTQASDNASCLKTTEGMLSQLRDFVTPGGLAKDIQDEAFRRITNHNQFLLETISQLTADVKGIGVYDPKDLKTWKQARSFSNEELLGVGWSEAQIARMRSKDRIDDLENNPLSDAELKAMQDYESNLKNNHEYRGSLPNSRASDRKAALAVFLNQSKRQYNEVSKSYNSVDSVVAGTSVQSDNSTGVSGNHGSSASCKQRVERIQNELKDSMVGVTSTCVAQRLGYRAFKKSLPIIAECEPEGLPHLRGQMRELEANNACNDGIHGPIIK